MVRWPTATSSPFLGPSPRWSRGPGLAEVLADLGLLHRLHERTRLEAETLTEQLTGANPRHENT